MPQDTAIAIRPSRDGDVDAMLAIYRRHIRRGIEEGVDEGDTPQPDDLRERRKNLKSRRFPHLVAIKDGAVVGYAYVVLFRKRAKSAAPPSWFPAFRKIAPRQSPAAGHGWFLALIAG